MFETRSQVVALSEEVVGPSRLGTWVVEEVPNEGFQGSSPTLILLLSDSRASRI